MRNEDEKEKLVWPMWYVLLTSRFGSSGMAFRYPLASAHDLDMIAGNKDASRRPFYLKRFDLHETFHSWKAFGSGDGIVEYLG